MNPMRILPRALALLLCLTIPFVASAGVRMQLAMDLGALHPVASSPAPMGPECAMADGAMDAPATDTPGCPGKPGQDCMFCSLLSTLPASHALLPAGPVSEPVSACTEAAALPGLAPGPWRPPRRS
jgi:hypothetical protein